MTISLSALERLAQAATPGPWCTHVTGPHMDGSFDVISVESYNPHSQIVRTRGLTNNPEYIAACSPDVILALLKVARASQKILTIPGEFDMWVKLKEALDEVSE